MPQAIPLGALHPSRKSAGEEAVKQFAAAALFLVWWFLMAPPSWLSTQGTPGYEYDLRAPLIRWQVLAGYDTLEECAEMLYFKRRQGDGMAGSDPAAREFAYYFQCVPDDDPRLSPRLRGQRRPHR